MNHDRKNILGPRFNALLIEVQLDIDMINGKLNEVNRNERESRQRAKCDYGSI